MSSAEQNIVATWRPEMAQFYNGIDAQQCAKEIVNIINCAGFGLGIGSGRSSGYGRYSVSNVE